MTEYPSGREIRASQISGLNIPGPAVPEVNHFHVHSSLSHVAIRVLKPSAHTPTNSNLELINRFIGKTVIVKSADYQVQGILIGCLRSFHKALESLILKDASGIHYVRFWEIIALKGESENERDKRISKAWNNLQIQLKEGNKPNVVLGEILYVGSSFIVEQNPSTNRVYFLNVLNIQKSWFLTMEKRTR